ncbi:MAG: hypothetical protein Q4C96_06105 [Planctomycetia bacterium]|nr:hypothetical protein [Planctomycetia bacterium]
MKSLFNRIVNDEQGVLTFEWILLLAILVIGIVGGLATVRDALNVQLGSSASAILALNQSYAINSPVTFTSTVNGLEYTSGNAAGSHYLYAGTTYTDGVFSEPAVSVTADAGTVPTAIEFPGAAAGGGGAGGGGTDP